LLTNLPDKQTRKKKRHPSDGAGMAVRYRNSSLSALLLR
jgi:hypothetical protein